MLGTLLTWMSERTEMIYLYCTANNINTLPPELTRAGRLDSVWWGDLPLADDCIEIIKIHCKVNKISLSDQDCRQLGIAAHRMQLTGAEIEHAIIESLYKVAHESSIKKQEKKIDMSFILNAMQDIRPYAISKAEELKKNRINALEKFEFTSSEAKLLVQKIADNNRAYRSEFTDES